MDDIISRQQAIVTAVNAAINWHKLANPQYSIAYCIGEAMRQLPPADVGPVVRCKDCKFRDEDAFCTGRGFPCQLVPDDGFCDKGEKE